MSNSIQVTLTPSTVCWRCQGDLINGDITTAELTLFMQTVWLDQNGIVYKVDQLPSIVGTPVELGFVSEFQSIQTKINTMISQMESQSPS